MFFSRSDAVDLTLVGIKLHLPLRENFSKMSKANSVDTEVPFLDLDLSNFKRH